MGSKNIVVLPAATGFFLPLAHSIARHYKELGEEAILVPSSSSDFSLVPLNQSGLVENADWIHSSYLVEYLQTESNDETGCNLVLWLFDDDGYQNSLEEIVNQIVDNVSGPLYYSIYPDGWLNKFWQNHTFFQIAIQVESRGMKRADRFHFACIHPQSVTDSFSDIVLDNIPQSLTKIYDSADYFPAVQDIVESLDSKAAFADSVIVVALRPWGSPAFHGGKYAFNSPNVKLSAIITKTIEDVITHFNLQTPLLVLRRDNREIEYMNSVVHDIATTTSMQVVDISIRLPYWIPLDCLFYCMRASGHLPKPLYLIAQDSSTPMAPLVLGLPHTAVFGLPSLCNSMFTPSSLQYVKSNLKMQKAFAEALAESKSVSIDDSLFAINLS